MKLAFKAVPLLGCLVLACSTSGENSTNSRERIVNGRPLDVIDASVSPAVSISRIDNSVANGNGLFGAGVLLRARGPGPRAVLTAKHVIAGQIPTNLVVTHGNDDDDTPPKTSTILGAPVTYEGGLGNVDLAILFLNNDVANLNTDVPVLDCDASAPSKLHCASPNTQVIEDGRTAGVMRGQFNDAVFGVGPVGNPDPWSLRYGPNKPSILFGGIAQAAGFGDSGMGCLDTGTGNLSVIHSDIESSGTPEKAQGVGTALDRFCGWVNKTLDSRQAFVQHADNDSVPDLYGISAVAGNGFQLSIDSSKNGSQSFPITLSGPSILSSAAVGNFSGGQLALALVDSGTLTTASFNGGPQPAFSGATATDYVTIVKARVNGDKIDDLIAQHSDGRLDVFLGGTSGLTLDPTRKPFPLRLDGDTLADFAWVNGAAVNTTSSLFGPTTRDVIPNTINLTLGKAGHFRRLSGDATGEMDPVVLGNGIVIWCKSTGGGGVACEPALDGPFLSGRTANNLTVSDLTGDGLDDLTIAYANNSSNQPVPPRIIVASAAGFSPQFGNKVRAVATPDLNGDGVNDTVTIDDPNGNVAIGVRLNPEGTGDIASFNTGIPFVAPVQIAVANVNDDGVSASALADGLLPKQDLVLLSGGKIYAFISNGDGTLAAQQLDGQTGFTQIRVTDANADGIADIEGTRADGSVTLYAGSSTGLKPAGDNFTGLPTPDGTDGKLLLLSGLGVDTVGATEARIRIRAAANDPASLDHLTVQVFDGDNGGLHQFDKQTNLLKTCYRLLPDPCGDGNMGNCAAGPQAQTPIVTVSSDTLHDNAWDTIFTGSHSPAASMGGNGQPPFAYDLRVYMSADCSQPPAVGTQVQVATADGFKVRATGMVSMPVGEFSLVGSDSTGTFGLPNLPYMPDTNYDGSFSLPIAVSSSATEIQLKESDADSLLDATRGVSLGANNTIQYQLLRPNGTQAPLTGGENTTAVNVVTNPSGNNNGVTTFDVETRIAKITTPTPGTWIWKWNNVMAGNAFHLFTPPGSPTTHEVLGALRERPTVTTAQQPTFWQAAPADLPRVLSVVLGHQNALQELEGSSRYLTTPEAVQSALDNTSGSLQGELERQLLTAKLNVQRSLALGEDINGALIYGRTLSVRTVMRAADDLVAGVDPLADDARVSQVIGLLSSVNLGELNYQLPGVPFPEDPMVDDDGDGIVNMKDNCPSVANPFQQDSDDDRIGDVCHVRPIASCVLQRSDSELEAFFGYENPLSFRAFAVGSRNLLTNDGQSLAPSQPSEFAAGSWSKAFHQTFEATKTLAWTLDGETVFANGATAACTGRELTVLDFAPQTVVFGSDSVVLGEKSRVTAQQGLPSVVSGGDIQIGRSSQIGNVFAGAHTSINDNTVVLGTAATGAGLNKRSTATVAATRTFTLRTHSLAWQVNFASTGLSDVTAPERHPYTLAPGEYGDVVVEPQGQLILGAGQYRFRSLTVRDQGSLRVAAGEAVVHIENSLQHSGDTRLLGDASLVIGYFGSAPATIVGSLQAAVIAPNAELSLGTAGHTEYAGTFFAKRVVVSPGTHLEYFDAKR